VITVLLYGWLGAKYGREHKLSIKKPAEAIKALSANYKEFAKEVAESSHAYRVIVGKEDRTDWQGMHLPATKTVKIVPLVSGSSGLGKIFLGAALIVASFYLPGTTYLSASSSFAISASGIASSIGFSLLLGGISQLIFAPPKAKSGSTEKAQNAPSYAFNGAVNTTGQGNPVAVCYGGPIRIGSQVVSAGLAAENLG
jgi:predicted phage tail protein